MPADSASEIVKFTILIPRESCTNAKAKYSSSVVPPDHLVHFHHCCSAYYAGSVTTECDLMLAGAASLYKLRKLSSGSVTQFLVE